MPAVIVCVLEAETFTLVMQVEHEPSSAKVFCSNVLLA